MIIVTGGAGFIGSALVWKLNHPAFAQGFGGQGMGRSDILIVDEIDHEEKEHNVAELQYEELIGIKEFREKMLAGDFDQRGVEAIFHLGACSDTTEKDWDYLLDNNVEYSKDIIRWCFDHDVRCVYASSGATYGDGGQGYSDDHDLFDQLEPLNLYGKSKLAVDVWARDGGYLNKVVGLRYFNVFGPNEYHKEHMMSVIAKAYPRLAKEGLMELFKSHSADWKDGEFTRDFLYIKDAVEMTLFFLKNDAAGVFNCGTGKARSWNDLAKAMFVALRQAQGKLLEDNIRYIDMPKDLQKQYQYETVADMSKLKAAGYNQKMTVLEDAVQDYIVNYLEPHRHLGE